MVLPGEVDATNILQDGRFIAASRAVGVVLLMPTKMPSRVTNTIGIHRQCLHRAMVSETHRW